MPSIFSLIPSKAVRGVTFTLKAGTEDQATGTLGRLKEIKALKVDAALSQRHSSRTDVTVNPVEEGLQITDNVDRKPLEFSLSGVITDTPLNDSSLVLSAVNSVAGIAGRSLTQSSVLNPRLSSAVTAGISASAAAVAGQLMDSSVNRVQVALQILQAAQDQAALLTITTKLKTYENMILRNLNVELDRTNGSSLPFTAELIEVRIVTLQTVKLPKDLIDAAINHSAPDGVDLGNQSKTAADASIIDQTKRKSLLKISAGAVTGG